MTAKLSEIAGKPQIASLAGSLLLACWLATMPALAQSGSAPGTAASGYPDRLIKIIVPFPPGGPTDVAARMVVDQLGARLKGSVVVENQPGAGGRTGSKAVAKAAPDGYTLLIGGTNLNAVIPALFKKLDYDPVKDFAPVAAIATDALVMVVGPQVPARSVAEFIAYAKANPGKLSTGAVVGIGSHFSIELFKIRAGLDMLFVPYKGGAPAIQDVMGGHIHMTMNNKSVLLALIQDDKVRALAVTNLTRWAELPEVPTMAESGFAGFPSSSWYGLLAPAATPPAIIDKLNGAVNEILRSKEAQTSFAKLGIDPNIGSPREFGAALASQVREWDGIVKETGIKVE